MGTPCSLDLWQCMLMCLFRLNLVVKLLPQLRSKKYLVGTFNKTEGTFKFREVALWQLYC